MKGISLAIETIIVVILAVTVLTVLLYFFRSTQGPVEDTLKLIQKQTNACSAYTSFDSRCSDISKVQNQDVLKNIADACKGLNRQRGDYPACAGQSTADIQCVKQCCKTFCPTTPV